VEAARLPAVYMVDLLADTHELDLALGCTPTEGDKYLNNSEWLHFWKQN
jgi:hypothetical protein